MRDIEGIEKVVERLKPYQKDIQAHFDSENIRFKALMAQDHNIIGQILKYHLIIEYYLNRFLAHHYSIEDLENVRLTFFQKAMLLPNSASAAAFVKPGILELNTLRNHFSHTLNVEISDDQLKNITSILDIIRAGVKFEKEIDKIIAFTTVACTFLIVAPSNLQEVFMHAFSDIRINAL